MLSIIAAISDNNVIGKDNKLMWNLPEDLKRFKQLTTGHTIIMGRKTFESLGRVLPNRKHIVITRDENYKIDDENVEIINDIEKIDKYINSEEENFVIGGAIIYKQLITKVNKMYITKVHQKFQGDAYFPIINEEEWKIIEKNQGIKDEKNPYDYEFITYIRKNK
jgi:dihydrofolate reductase